MPTIHKAATEEAIRVHAYHLWEQHGRPHGRDVEFWHRAAELIGPRPDEAPRAAAASRSASRSEKAKAAAAPAKPVALAKAPQPAARARPAAKAAKPATKPKAKA